jgi:hypothetical protein
MTSHDYLRARIADVREEFAAARRWRRRIGRLVRRVRRGVSRSP